MNIEFNQSDSRPTAVRRIGWKAWILIPTILGAVVGATVAARTKALYRSDTVILVVPQRVPESYVRSALTTKLSDRLQSISQQVLSRTRLERIINDFDLYKEERRTGVMEEIVDRMRKNIEMKVEDGGTFAVGFIGTDPRTVMKVTERLASLFIEENLRDREYQAEGTNQFLLAQLEDVRRATRGTEQAAARSEGEETARGGNVSDRVRGAANDVQGSAHEDRGVASRRQSRASPDRRTIQADRSGPFARAADRPGLAPVRRNRRWRWRRDRCPCSAARSHNILAKTARDT